VPRARASWETRQLSPHYARDVPWLPGFEDLAEAVSLRSDDLVVVDDPILGRFEGPVAVAGYRAASAAWLRPARVSAVEIGRAVAGGRAVGEFEVSAASADRTAVLPLACVVDVSGLRGPEMRVYVSEWPVTGARARRASLLPMDGRAMPSGVVGRYVAALGAGDAPTCVSCYEPDGALQGAGGPAWAVHGVDRLTAAYGDVVSDGGLVLEPRTLTVDPPRTAFEFTLRSWGGIPVGQAGMSVYTLGPSGRFAWNRVYDDVADPRPRA
jgi:hypothetical protein